jgi:hypothetical protein
MPAFNNGRNDIHYDQFLTDTSLGFERTNPGSVAYRAATSIPVLFQTGKFMIYNRGDWFRDQVKTRPLGGEVELVTYGTSDGTYNCQEYGLGHRIDDRERANNSKRLVLDQNGRDLLMRQHSIRRDRFFAVQAMATGVWGLDITGVSGTPSTNEVKQWNDAASTPYDDIETQRERMFLATGFMPNVLVLGATTYLRLRRHPQLTALAGDNAPNIVMDEALRQYFMVDEILVARSVYNSALEGATDSFSYTVNAKSALLLHRNPLAAGGATRTAIGIFGWEGLHNGAANEDGVVMGWHRIGLAYSDQLNALAAWDMKIMDASLGVFFTTVVA